MESNVLSWHVALEQGYEPRLYPYAAADVPVGVYEADLHFKIWAKKAMAICCYFRQKDTGVRFQLTVYRRHEDKLYRLEEGLIDFRVCPVNKAYVITIVRNGRENVTLKSALIKV